MKFDIRTNADIAISAIKFKDDLEIEKGGWACYIQDVNESNFIQLDNKDDAKNLILALQKALDLGWFKD